ncbi:MAG: proline dehydrogenase family protein [Bryobacteraceae bacterium]|jgi:proline dehydrogenase
METSPAARRLSARFVAGVTPEEAFAVCRRLNAENIVATLDHLGERVTSLGEASAARDVYLRLLPAIHQMGIRSNVSLKLTEFGLDFSYEQCLANVERLAGAAASLHTFVRVDMESGEYTGRTLDLVSSVHAKYRSVGAVVQAYLRRSRQDVERLSSEGIPVRLCKGAYLEPASLAFQRKSEVDRNFVELMKLLLDRGTRPAIATHDEKIIARTKAYAAQRNLPRAAFEFQMLYGIRRDLQRALGYPVRLYVPFGAAWYPYLMRRLAERPANVLFLLRNLFRE